MPADLYAVLGTSNDAATEEIKRAYRERVREYHPDVNDHPEGDAQFKLIRKANDVLSDPGERKDYDRLGHREYVDERLENLPPVSVFPDEDLPEGSKTTDDVSASKRTSTTGEASTTREASTTDGQETSAGTVSGRESGSRSSGATGDTAASQRSQTERESSGTDASTSDSTSAGPSTKTAGGNESSTASGGQTTTVGADRSSWDAAAGSTRTTSDSTVPAGVRRRRGLKRWYGVVALSLLGYLGGLGLYALSRRAALQSFVDDVIAAPIGTLLGAFPLASPAEYLLDGVEAATAGTLNLGLVLLVGTVLLPLVVLTTVGRFGRGAAWMYALPSLAPAISLVLWPAVTVPTWGALLGLIVLPILSGGGFLVDVGRYLRATR